MNIILIHLERMKEDQNWMKVILTVLLSCALANVCLLFSAQELMMQYHYLPKLLYCGDDVELQ